ncbi:MAG: hypothetical protein RL059_1355 [Bacteroidota bacterium]|jgi:hypothetical protein
MKKTLINLGLTAGAVYVLYRICKKDDVIPMNKPLPVDASSGFDGSLQEIVANNNELRLKAKLKAKRDRDRDLAEKLVLKAKLKAKRDRDASGFKGAILPYYKPFNGAGDF